MLPLVQLIDVTLEYQRYNGNKEARRMGKMLALLAAEQQNILGIKHEKWISRKLNCKLCVIQIVDN